MGASPKLKARIAGSLYFLAVLTAVFAEFVDPGSLGIAAVAIPVSCYMAVTLLLFDIFRPVNRRVAFAAACFGFVGLTCEALQWQPRGVNIALPCHGLYCLLIGWIMLRSTFLPRMLGALMAAAGLIWLIYLSPSFARLLSPYNTALGLLGEASPMLWLLVVGVNVKLRAGNTATPLAPS